MTNDRKENMEASIDYKGGNCTSLDRRITEIFSEIVAFNIIMQLDEEIETREIMTQACGIKGSSDVNRNLTL